MGDKCDIPPSSSAAVGHSDPVLAAIPCDCPHHPPVSRVLDEMEEARPADAPALGLLGPVEEVEEVEECQLDAFLSGGAQWWRVGVMHQRHVRGRGGDWYPQDAPEVVSMDDSRTVAAPTGAAGALVNAPARACRLGRANMVGGQG